MALQVRRAFRTETRRSRGTYNLKAYLKRCIKSLLRIGVPQLKLRIVRDFKHDPHAFTQGLTYSDGLIYESTGKPGKSSVRCLDPCTGQILLMRPAPDADVWAEGLSVQGNRLIQLTWKHRKAFVYSLPDLVPAGEINYSGEGWGIATDHGHFITSDGSDQLMFRDKHFEITRRVRVTLNRIPIKRLNDLEFVEGIVYANVWYSSEILAISAQSGKVLAIYDCQDLVLLENPLEAEAVLNGIAFNPNRGTFFLTGKYWARIFEVEFDAFE